MQCSTKVLYNLIYNTVKAPGLVSGVFFLYVMTEIIRFGLLFFLYTLRFTLYSLLFIFAQQFYQYEDKSRIQIDVHQLTEGRKMVVGGIEVPHTKGPLGHSDGDTLIHAICDALLGAANMRDIGYHFPDTSAAYENIDSKIILKKPFS